MRGDIHGRGDSTVTLMRAIERAAARNLQDYVAAVRDLAPHVAPGSIEVAGGAAAFTGVGSPLTTVKGTRPLISPDDLRRIEAFFRDHGAPAVTIETAPWALEETKRLLDRHGYREQGHESVVTRTAGPIPSSSAVRAEAVSLQEWPELMDACFEPPDTAALSQLVASSAHVRGMVLYAVRESDRWIGCAQSLTYDDVVIFCNDGTQPAARRRGVQTALISERLRACPPGVIVTAEVAPGSASERNYLRCGFQVAYVRTHHVAALR